MENKTENREFEISLVSILKMFKGKLKMLVAIGLLSAILGGTIGALNATMGKKTYGNKLAFYFPTPEQTNYSMLIPILESDLFTENVLIGTKTHTITDSEGNEISVSIPDLPYSDDEEAEVVKYEAEKLKLSKSIKDYKTALKSLPLEIDNLKAQLDAANSIYSPLKEEYSRLWTVYSDGLSETALSKLVALENSEEYISAKSDFEAAQETYSKKVIEQKKLSEELFNAEKALTEINEKSEKIINSLRAAWRNDEANKDTVKIFNESVKYSFTSDGATQQTQNSTDNKTPTGKFLYVDIQIPKDEALANKIIDNILLEIDSFVASNMTPVETNDVIECQHMSYGDAKDLNENGLFSSILIFALIVFAAVEILACILIISSNIKKTYFSANIDEKTASQETLEEENDKENDND